MTKTRKVVASGLVALLTGATLAACGDAPEEENGGSGSQAAASDFLPCIVSDAGGFDDSRASLHERLTSSDPTSEEIVSRAQERQRLELAVGRALDRLGERERFIVRRRLLADDEDELSLVEMGKRLGVSTERVRQLEVRAKRQLRACLEPDTP